jgi:hypothetical protein
MQHTAHVKGICHEFIKIYDGLHIEGVKGLRAQSFKNGLNDLEYAQIGDFYTSQQFSTSANNVDEISCALSLSLSFFTKSGVLTMKMTSKLSYHLQILCNVCLL